MNSQFRFAAVLALTIGTANAAHAAPVNSQVDKGQADYQASCAMCHGANLEGGAGPALTGPTFVARYKSVGALLDYMSQNMPVDSPGSLSNQDYVDILAYLLQKNGHAATDAPMTFDQALTSKDSTGPKS